MTGVLRAGNERVYLGRDGWLFYRQDVDYLTGGSFLDRAQSDPHQAILLFHRDLEARGVTLVVMPTPVKPSVHPEKLSGHFSEAAGALHNPSFRAFVDKLRRDGVLVFDPSEDFAAARRSSPQYLATDTHWRPETMEAAAERLAAVIEASAGPLPAADPGFKVEQTAVISTGDVARMLDLPEDAAYPHEEVTLRRVTQPDGSPWRSVRTADVLLLGDSFSNIYSLETMGWGTSAGFAEHLSYALRRPIDRIVQNDEGAFATRMPLTQDPSRLIGKRVVVYQFAARELAFGDWQILPLPQSTDKTR
jgi:alginate O-acetyltransferase complex protein AlgJ